MAPRTTTIQTLIFSKEIFKTARAAIRWSTEHDFKTSKIDETETSFRIRQRDPEDFQPGSFRTIEIRTGIKAVVGRLNDSVALDEAINDGILYSMTVERLSLSDALVEIPDEIIKEYLNQ